MKSSLHLKELDYIRNHGVVPSVRWGADCVAYNVQLIPPSPIRRRLATIQEQIAQSDESLLRVPDESLHITVSSLLGVWDLSPGEKERLWKTAFSSCNEVLTNIATRYSAFPVTYVRLIVTRDGVLAVAQDDGQTAALREHIASSFPAVKFTKRFGIHTTLVRYAAQLNNPRRFIETVNDVELNLRFTVRNMVLRKEQKYPSLQYETIQKFHFGSDSEKSREKVSA